MSDKTKENSNTKERILAFKLAKELRPEDLKLVAGAGRTKGFQPAPTRPGEGPDQNDYVFDYTF